ncbi:hypothetical protein CC85DRAFT_283750, partial [Cutaneotrichosporon oleaginosum]
MGLEQSWTSAFLLSPLFEARLYGIRSLLSAAMSYDTSTVPTADGREPQGALVAKARAETCL